MSEHGITIKAGQEGSRIEIQCPHQNGLLYAVPGEASWVCSAELLPAHAMAGFLKELVKLGEPRVQSLMQRWGLYYRDRPVAPSPGETEGKEAVGAADGPQTPA